MSGSHLGRRTGRWLRVALSGAVVGAAVFVSGAAVGSAPAALAVTPPTVRGIAPAAGPIAGGQKVLIWGSGFASSGTITVTVNGVACASVTRAVASSTTAVYCTTGAGTRGVGDVVLTNPDTGEGTLADAYAYAESGDNMIVTWGTKTIGGTVDPGAEDPVNTGDPDGRNLLPIPITSSGVLNGRIVVAEASGSGAAHSCAIADDGKAYCWGANSTSQLGNGTASTNFAPVAVTSSGALNGKSLVQIAVGSETACAVSSEAKAYCWGENYYGQVGDNSNTSRTTPVAVHTGAAISGKAIVSVGVGDEHACALSSEGKVYCWGENSWGQVGDNSNNATNDPVQVFAGSGGALNGKTVVALAVGYWHNCALTSDGVVACWGYNAQGQLGDGTQTNADEPVVVSTSGALAGKTITAIAAGGNHTCALDSDGKAYCWGANSYLQGGVTPASYTGLAPAAVDTSGALSGVTLEAISAGYGHTCARDDGGQAYCWGSNLVWQIGSLNTDTDDVGGGRLPAKVSLLTELRTHRVISVGTTKYGSHALITKVGASTPPEVPAEEIAWGSSGSINPEGMSDPNGVLTGTNPVQQNEKCLVTAAGTAACRTVYDDALVAVDQTGVLAGKTIVKIEDSGQYGHRCVLTSDSGLYCWGSNSVGQLGDGTTTTRPSAVAVKTDGALAGKTIVDFALTNVTYYSGYSGTTRSQTCAITSDGGLYCWGAGTAAPPAWTGSNVPVAVDLAPLGGQTPTKVILGRQRCVVTDEGSVFCSLLNEPLAAMGGPLVGKEVIDIAGDGDTVCALTSDNLLYCWGTGTQGELGNGASVNSADPVAVTMSGALAGKTVVHLSAGANTACVIDFEGAVYCWGRSVSDNVPNKLYTLRVPVESLATHYYGYIGWTRPLGAGDPGPRVKSVSPTSGLAAGGTNITVTGSSFDTVGTVTVAVGGTPCTSVVVTSATELTCTTGARSGGRVDVAVTNGDGKQGRRRSVFRYTPAPTVSSVSPAVGPIGGGTDITITGTGFVAGAAVTVGGNACTDISVDSPTSITCTTPAGTPGAADVVVTNSDTQSGTKTGGFSYGDAVTAVSPTGGPTAGGTDVTITGTGFVSGATVTVGGTACTNVSFVSATSITCKTPAGSAGKADIVVTNPNTETISGDDLFEYVPTPTVTSVSPTSGKTAGGTAITVTGTNFATSGTVGVSVGGSPCTAVDVISATEIKCTTPAGSSGAADIVVTNPYSISGTGDDLFTFVPPPTVGSVSPTIVSTAGGTTITVTGTGFLSGATVTVGGSTCTSVSVVSATSITCSSPAKAIGTYDIVVENTDTQSATGSSLLEYRVGPAITSVYPAVRKPAGGTTVQIFGSGFVDGATVTVGGTACSLVEFVDATQVKCTLPSGSVGYATIVVTNPGNPVIGSASDKFRYLDSASVTSVAPAFGPVGGGTKITVTGTGFDTIGTVNMKLGGVDCLGIVVVSATSLTCTTPAGSVGKAGSYIENVAVSGGGSYGTDGFEYVDLLGAIGRFYTGASAKELARIQKFAQNVLDGRGNCDKELGKLNKEIEQLVKSNRLSAENAKQMSAWAMSSCLPQLPTAPPPTAPLVASRLSVEPLDAVPACSVSVTNASVILDFVDTDAELTQYSYLRSDFEYATMWVRIDGGGWGPGIGLDPTNGSAAGIGWSSDFVRGLLYVGGVFNLGGLRTYNVEFAVGSGITGDPYDAGKQVCTASLAVTVGELPVTGSNTSDIVNTAIWFTLAGALLAAVGVRRRRTRNAGV